MTRAKRLQAMVPDFYESASGRRPGWLCADGSVSPSRRRAAVFQSHDEAQRAMAWRTSRPPLRMVEAPPPAKRSDAQRVAMESGAKRQARNRDSRKRSERAVPTVRRRGGRPQG